MTIKLIYLDIFYRAVRRLQKRYPHILEDVETLSDQLERGETPGDRIPGIPSCIQGSS